MNKVILIIGKSQIALRHYSILKKINKNFILYFKDKNNKIWIYRKDKFLLEKKKLLVNEYYLVLICTPSNTHIRYLNLYYQKSKFIFVEKPLSNSLSSLENFKRKKIETSIKPKILIGYNLRFSKALLKFKKTINYKKYGKLLYVACQVGRSLDQWRDNNLKLAASNKKKGGGVILELSHELDYLNWIFGPIAVLSSKINNLKKFNLNVEENYFAIIKSNKNIIINLLVDMVRCDPKRFCEAIFDKATIRLDLIDGSVKITNNKTFKLYKYDNDLDNSYKNMWYDYLKNSEKIKTKDTINSSLQILGLIETIKKNK